MRWIPAVALVVSGLGLTRAIAAQAGPFDPDGKPPREVRLMLRDSDAVNLVQPWFSEGMFHGWLRIGPVKVVGLDSVPLSRVTCYVIGDDKLSVRNGLAFFALLGGAALAGMGASVGRDFGGESFVEAGVGLARLGAYAAATPGSENRVDSAAAAGSPRACYPPKKPRKRRG